MRILTIISSLFCLSVFAQEFTQEETRLFTEEKIKAEKGDPVAQWHVAGYYRGGIDGKENPVEAAKWWRKSAEQGYAPAQFNLGVQYEIGEGVLKDHNEALKWMRKAADQGNDVAQCYVGDCYVSGEVVTRDFAEAYAYYNLAGVTDESARKKRDKLESLISPAQIKAGQKRSKQLQVEIEARIADKKKAEKK
jgi:hypothetical protein